MGHPASRLVESRADGPGRSGEEKEGLGSPALLYCSRGPADNDLAALLLVYPDPPRTDLLVVVVQRKGEIGEDFSMNPPGGAAKTSVAQGGSAGARG